MREAGKRCGLKDSAAHGLKRRIAEDLLAFFGGEVIRHLLDGVKPRWESDLHAAQGRHGSHREGQPPPRRPQTSRGSMNNPKPGSHEPLRFRSANSGRLPARGAAALRPPPPLVRSGRSNRPTEPGRQPRPSRPERCSRSRSAARSTAISLALGDGDCWLESFRSNTGEAGGHGRLLLPWPALADACRADPGTLVELAACPQGAGAGTLLRLRLCQGGARLVRFHPVAAGQAMPAPALPDGESLRLSARGMEALATVAPFADWRGGAGPWRSGVCFSPADGGCLIAGNEHRWARVPLPGWVPPFARSFVLPLGAVGVLLHPDFLGYENQLTLPRSGAEPRVMFRAWDHLLVTPVLAAGRLEEEFRLRGACAVAGHPWALDPLRRGQLLDWLRALRDPHAPVSLIWRACGRVSVVQGEGCGRGARLTLSAAFRGERPEVLPPRLVLPPRDLAAALNIGGSLGVAVAGGGRVSLSCRGAGGACCQVASLAGAAGEACEPGGRYAA